MLLAGLLAVFALPRKHGLIAAVRKTCHADSRTLARSLAGLFPTPANARAIGICYLRAYPERSDRRLLLADLGLDAAGTAAHDVPSLRRHLRDGQQRDFIAGDTVMVKRWILSRTEASVCALVALS